LGYITTLSITIVANLSQQKMFEDCMDTNALKVN